MDLVTVVNVSAFATSVLGDKDSEPAARRSAAQTAILLTLAVKG